MYTQRSMHASVSLCPYYRAHSHAYTNGCTYGNGPTTMTIFIVIIWTRPRSHGVRATLQWLCLFKCDYIYQCALRKRCAASNAWPNACAYVNIDCSRTCERAHENDRTYVYECHWCPLATKQLLSISTRVCAQCYERGENLPLYDRRRDFAGVVVPSSVCIHDVR